MVYLKQQFRDALSDVEPGDDTTNASGSHRLVRDKFGASARSWLPASPTMTRKELSGA